jgi:hypothetical protein
VEAFLAGTPGKAGADRPSLKVTNKMMLPRMFVAYSDGEI